VLHSRLHDHCATARGPAPLSDAPGLSLHLGLNVGLNGR
jgi:hypothetical protein